jgi:hypothetical protein
MQDAILDDRSYDGFSVVLSFWAPSLATAAIQH